MSLRIVPALPEIPRGHKIQFVRCKTCRQVAHYHYLPHSLSNPVMTLPCGHGLTVRLHEAATSISEEEALADMTPPAGLYRQHEDGTVERVEVDVVGALKRAISYVEFGYDEECREEAAEAKHDLDMCRAVLKALSAS